MRECVGGQIRRGVIYKRGLYMSEGVMETHQCFISQ